MPRYSIAFVTPSRECALKHRLVEGADQDSALRAFFAADVSEFYTNDEQGYHYFREDFFDEAKHAGRIVKCE